MTDRQTDGQTEFSSLDRVYIACSAVKMHCRRDSAEALYTVKLMEHITDAGANFHVKISIYTAKSTWS